MYSWNWSHSLHARDFKITHILSLNIGASTNHMPSKLRQLVVSHMYHIHQQAKTRHKFLRYVTESSSSRHKYHLNRKVPHTLHLHGRKPSYRHERYGNCNIQSIPHW